jgi:hypothetical protein
MRYIVSATVALIIVITNTPKKLRTAAIIIALPGLMDRVETQVAIAFGASVQPLTKITPKVNSVTTSKGGFPIKFSKIAAIVIVIFVSIILPFDTYITPFKFPYQSLPYGKFLKKVAHNF